MATINQIAYLEIVKYKIKEPILIVGSKIYDYDAKDIESYLNLIGFKDCIGIDIESGKGVNVVANVCDIEHPFFTEKENYFNTVICMEIMTHTPKPWLVGQNIDRVSTSNASLIVSECFVRKISRMPSDYWRFTHDAFKVLFENFKFDEALAMKSLTRTKKADLMPYDDAIFQIMHEKNEYESNLSFFIRKVHRKLFDKKIFQVSRLLPEQTFYAFATKRHG